MNMQNGVLATLLTFLITLAGSPAMAAQGVDVPSVKQEMNQTVTELQQYSVTQRDKANDKAAEAVEKLDEHIGELEKHISGQWQQLSPDERKKKQEVLAALRKQRAEVKKAHRDMKKEKGEAWQQAKETFQSAYNEARQQFGDLTS